MRPLFLSLEACILVLGAAWAQNTGDSRNAPQLPVGQTFKQFEYPTFQDGKLKSTLYATEATGITLNRAETTDLKIQIYDNGAVTTTVTSPKADLYVAEQKMRTKNTVHIERADTEATSQNCDFDLKTKKYLLRTNVKVILKHFDLSLTPANGAATPPASTHAPTGASRAPAPTSPRPAPSNKSLLDSPGSYADTNSAPIPPPSSGTK
jgi:LPS export ABC transporter protein LptC